MVMVTVLLTAVGKNMGYDMELPTNTAAIVLIHHIAETLNEYHHSLRLSVQNKVLWSKRLDRMINPDETLEHAGIWNGDYIELREL